MKKKAEDTHDLLIKTASEKYDRLMAGPVFSTDFESARLISQMIVELKLLKLENKAGKKMIEFNKIYLKKYEMEISLLKQKNDDLMKLIK